MDHVIIISVMRHGAFYTAEVTSEQWHRRVDSKKQASRGGSTVERRRQHAWSFLAS